LAVGYRDEPAAAGPAELLDRLAQRRRRFDFNNQIADVDIESIRVFNAHTVTLDQSPYHRRMCLVCHGASPKKDKTMNKWGWAHRRTRKLAVVRPPTGNRQQSRLFFLAGRKKEPLWPRKVERTALKGGAMRLAVG